MIVHTGLAAASLSLQGVAVTIGNFDGVHKGHQRLLQRTLDHARRRHVPAAALTFVPHPVRVLAPDRAPPLICSFERRRELLAEQGLDVLVEQPFDASFAATSAEDFERRLLDGLQARAVVVGHDFTYGRGRRGGIGTLHTACQARGALLEVVEPVTVDGLVASSTKVREFVLEGNVAAAAALLGRPFEVEGPVLQGVGRGRTLGVPTANVAPQGELLPAFGVYAVRVQLPDGALVGGACNVGVNPTFAGARPVAVETHLLDWSGDLYGARLRLRFAARLRAERRFPGAEALVAQIRDDLAAARRALAGA